MKAIRKILINIITCGVIVAAFSSPVTFTEPQQWITLRNGNINAKLIADTSAIKSKVLKLYLYSNSEKGKKLLAQKNVKVGDGTGIDVNFGNIAENLIGGKNFLSIVWKAVKDKKEGELVPFGIAVIDNKKIISEAVKLNRISSVDEINNIKNPIEVNGIKLSLAANKNYLFAKIEGIKDVKSVTLAFDGKNGKYAFTGYSDKYMIVGPDSIKTVCYQRKYDNEKIIYNEDNWVNEIKKEKKDNCVIVSIPWYDLGIILTDGRMFGFELFVESKDGNVFSWGQDKSINKFIPATWGTLKY